MLISDITVIVPTKNEAHNVPQLIQSIPQPVNLIVVDASDDHTPELCLKLRPQNTIVIRSQAHIAEARNIGARAASTNWLLFTDADVFFSCDYFTRLVNLTPLHALYGIKMALDEQASYYQRFTRWQIYLDRMSIPAVSGSNFLVNAQVFQKVGAFNPGLLVNEDTELGYRLKKGNYRLDFNRRLIVFSRDHRRLMRGKLRKDLHTLSRCTLIYLNLFPTLWMHRDWGYWSK
jgi:glycosyltransferase involved in cell wall biosynthesis